MEQLNLEQKMTWVQGLLIACPLGQALDDCPARELRGIPLKKRLGLVKEMSGATIDQLIAHHRACLAKREN